ncbi:hypothetical protein LS73_000150 [Helicobacter muridarum]|uniref:Tail fiber protein n=1 Tax=Helicobacter muridarum TaxID=216 RepID=A0A099TX72_9HELI|nr:hypothetical protein [Helicobacter muridarum]TLE01594.1 hypothetical protein LS73_000150 [Helicobacter muridarum]STQ86208.1 Uncharacterised protein [Helicobacter muridarum]
MTKITPLPQPPTTQDSINFDIRADAFLESLPKFADELNAFGLDVDEVGNVVHDNIQSAVETAKEDLKATTKESIASIEHAADKRAKELKAIAGIKSDSWQNIAQFILLLLREIRDTQEKELIEQDKMLEYKLFFRSSLPKGYKAPNSLLKIRDYPLAWFYSLQTSKEAQVGTPKGYFRLPQGNLYTKGVSVKSLVGSFGEQQLLAHSHSYGHWTPTSEPLGGSSRRRNMVGGFVYNNTSVYGGNTNEVRRVHLLEGYYVG